MNDFVNFPLLAHDTPPAGARSSVPDSESNQLLRQTAQTDLAAAIVAYGARGGRLGPTRPLPPHLRALEGEAIHILRETVAQCARPVFLYSIGKDSTVMLHLARKAFWPAPPPFPFLHIATGWDFRAMLQYRDLVAGALGLRLLVHTNEEGARRGVSPLTATAGDYARAMITDALRQALEAGGFDAAFGGARRDEEQSRAKERIYSLRDARHGWDPRRQRPEPWGLCNGQLAPGESLRVFPLSNWTEADIWAYVAAEAIPLVPLYFAASRPVIRRSGGLLMLDDHRLPLAPGEVPEARMIRFRTMGCWPLTTAIDSEARTVDAIIEELRQATGSERQGRLVDHDSAASMERKKREGYF
jgi:sulfate adenylyltransferase subunit 2